MNKTIKQFGWLLLISIPLIILFKFPEPYDYIGDFVLGGVIMYFIMEVDNLKEKVQELGS